ncbi:Solute carrier 26 [Lobulomyces angularis]|nr:Solute carrier 26 [Lobulomyces angularis]
MIIHYYDILFNNAKLKLKSKYIKTLNNVKLYNFKTFISDLLAGLTISSVIVPQAIAYSSLARISPISALMTAVFPVMIYSIFGSSLHLSVGPEAFTSILFGMTITSQTTLGHDAINTASWLTILIGTFCLILSILRAGYLENILTGYLLIGFITGIALLVMVEQLPNLLGLDIKFGNVSLSEKMSLVFSKTAATKNLTLLLGIEKKN